MIRPAGTSASRENAGPVGRMGRQASPKIMRQHAALKKCQMMPLASLLSHVWSFDRRGCQKGERLLVV